MPPSLRPSLRLIQSRSIDHCAHTLQPFRWRPTSTPRRFNSTTALPPNYKPRSKIRPVIWAVAFFATGMYIGKALTMAIKLYDRVERDSPEDLFIIESIHELADELPLVSQLMAQAAQVDGAVQEVPLDAEDGNVLVERSMRGSMGLVTPRAFWNERERELVMIVHNGGALCGWPGIVHGGCTATVMIEGMGRAINCLEGGQQSVRPPDPSELALTYLKPVNAVEFYILKAKVQPQAGSARLETDIGAEKDLAKKLTREKSGITSRMNSKYDVDCTVENLKGQMCMKAKAVWEII